MISCLLVVLSALAAGLQAALLKFPPDFKFGAATSSYQIEGAWNSSDKTANVWDEYTHQHKALIADGGDGDVACDSYNLWRRDIAVAEELGLDFYRFSISWSRLLPTGFPNQISEDGRMYYDQLIDGLLEKGIEPVITLYHWDLPQRFQSFGGWANPLLSDWFASYARVAFSLYGDRVKTWITINEPLVVCDGGYTGAVPPGIEDPEVGAYLCNKNILIAHAKAWRVYDTEFRSKYNGKVSLSNHVIWYESGRRSDNYLAELAMENCAGRYSHPIFSKEGGWPPALEKIVAENSKKQGYNKSRLPAFTAEEIELVKGTYDFYGINHYTSRVVRKAKLDEEIGPWPLGGSKELGIMLDSRTEWKPTDIWWYRVNPKGFRNSLLWLKKQYGDINFLVTENGFPTVGSNINDKDRVQYYKNYLSQLLFAMIKDGVNVTCYTAWSLMDNFEWREGYRIKFGLYEVNFTDPDLPRTPRSSALFYKNVIQTRSLDSPDESNSYVVWLTFAIVLVAIILIAIAVKFYRAANENKRKMEYESVAFNSDQNFSEKMFNS